MSELILIKPEQTDAEEEIASVKLNLTMPELLSRLKQLKDAHAPISKVRSLLKQCGYTKSDFDLGTAGSGRFLVQFDDYFYVKRSNKKTETIQIRIAGYKDFPWLVKAAIVYDAKTKKEVDELAKFKLSITEEAKPSKTKVVKNEKAAAISNPIKRTENKTIVVKKSESKPKSKAKKPPQPVKCIETGESWKSLEDAGIALGQLPLNIGNSARSGGQRASKGLHFIFI